MKSEVIKVVAGGGKTIKSVSVLKNSSNGLYLAFTNSVINEMAERGFLARTIDGLFQSFILPKFMRFFSLASPFSTIVSADDMETQTFKKSAGCVQIEENGNIVYKANGSKSSTGLNIRDDRSKILTLKKYRSAIETVFGKERFLINNQQRSDLAFFLMTNYENEVARCITSRFDYVVIDEAQDLFGYREQFATLLYNHRDECPIILLGDDMQNVNNRGHWFESLSPDKMFTQSYRCPENICEWIRGNLGIEIHGDGEKLGKLIPITNETAIQYDDGVKCLLYMSKSGLIVSKTIESWKGPKMTIKSAKGLTIDGDIVVAGGYLDIKNIYTALTRTTKNAYLAAEAKDKSLVSKSMSSPAMTLKQVKSETNA